MTATWPRFDADTAEARGAAATFREIRQQPEVWRERRPSWPGDGPI